MNTKTSFPAGRARARRLQLNLPIVSLATYAGLALLWLFDVMAWSEWDVPAGATDSELDRLGLVPLCSGLVAALILLLPARWIRLETRAWLTALLSLALTVFAVTTHLLPEEWSFLELACLLILLVRVCRTTSAPAVVVALVVMIGAAAIVLPYRMWGDPKWPSSFATFLTLAAGGAVALGCYLRSLDARRARAVVAVRDGERMELARDLHDFIAHHVTGIVVQADAARAVLPVAPDQIDPILENIRRAGMETLDSMRRLVRVLREEENRTLRPGELVPQLARMVSDFSSGGEQDASLHLGTAARTTKLAPEVETSVQRVVQEALTNVRRHAPGATVAVRVDAEDDRLRVEVRNSAPRERSAVPAGGRGGFGIVGLRERVEAVEGTLETGSTADGGWRVTAVFPVLSTAVEGSPA
ncbi:sensor histidine kinase [Streptomyces flaveus]|uniref:sensor histidine kinase n=1 Tax=Streptomyces flaveus TaxID=66370 RepID=UPI00331D91B2